MKKYPGITERVGIGHSITLNEEQVSWLKEWYPITENIRIAKAMGIGLTSLRNLVDKYGLSKSEAGLRAIRHRRNMKAAKTNERNGCYDRKRGHPCSAATMAGNARRWQEEREGIRENAMLKMKRENPEKYRRWVEKRSNERKETIRKEKMRMVYGLERKTSLLPVVLCPFKKSQIGHRSNALRRGYILMEDCKEGSPYRYMIYYDKETQRSEKFEENLRKDGFKVERWV